MGMIKGVEVDFSKYDEKTQTPPKDSDGGLELEGDQDFSFEDGILGDNQENSI